MGIHIPSCPLVEFRKFLEALGLAALRRKNSSFNLGKSYFLWAFVHFHFIFCEVVPVMKLGLSVIFFFFAFV